MPGADPERPPLPKRKAVYEGDEPVPATYHPLLTSRPTLALLGWSPYALCWQHSALLQRAAAHLAAVRRHLGLALNGLMVWCPSQEELENLRFWLAFRDPGLVRELLLESSDALYDFEQFSSPQALPGSTSVPTTFAAARADLLAKLADSRGQRHASASVRAAWETYDALIERDLIQPLQEWALAKDHPAARSSAVELASVCGLTHRMGPILQELQRLRLEKALAGDAEPNTLSDVTQYLQLVNRIGALIRDVQSWD